MICTNALTIKRHGLIIGMGVRASPQLTPYLEDIIETTKVGDAVVNVY